MSSELMGFTRRQAAQVLLSGGAAVVGSLALGVPSARASRLTPEVLKGPYLDLTTPRGNMLAMARLNGDLDLSKTRYGWYAGTVMGVREGEPVRDLFRFEGFSCARLEPLEDGGYRKLLREVGYYRDKDSGEIMEEWDNVYTGERVRVVPVANDPFNSTITEYFPQPPSYGGLNEQEVQKIPFVLPWEPRGAALNLDRHIHLFYPSALQPDDWPRESPGPMSRVTESFLYEISNADMQNEELTNVPHRGTWMRITPWLPWMLMDQAQGHIVYTCFMGSAKTLDDIDPVVLDYTERNYPKFLTAPERYEEPSLSSLENYAREQTPAEPREANE